MSTQLKKEAVQVHVERISSTTVKISWEQQDLSPVAIHRALATDDGTYELLVNECSEAYWIDETADAAKHFYYVVHQLSTDSMTVAAERAVALEGISNFRDMGGYVTEDQRKVKWGKLFRSADLSRATAADIAKIASLQLAWIFDLRTLNERTSNQTPVFAAEVNEHLSFLESADPSAILNSSVLNEQMLVDINRQMAHRTGIIQSFVKRWLLLEGKPFLFHCMAGKDRTGFIGAFILRALGVPLEQIKQDYALTNTYWKANFSISDTQQLEQISQLPTEIIQAMMEAREAYIAAAMDEIDHAYGGFSAYWQEGLGFTEAELHQLRDTYLE